MKVGDKVRVNCPRARAIHGRVGMVVMVENLGVVDHVVVMDGDETKTPRYLCESELEVVMCDEQGRFWLANGWGVMETELPVFRSAQYRRAGMSAFAERVVASAEWSDADSLRVDAGRLISGTY